MAKGKVKKRAADMKKMKKAVMKEDERLKEKRDALKMKRKKAMK